MTRVELLEAASMKLAEAVILLAEAGERRLAADAGEIAEIAEFRAPRCVPQFWARRPSWMGIESSLLPP
jgi:hypothetical protein